jgi:hypothetical protein
MCSLFSTIFSNPAGQILLNKKEPNFYAKNDNIKTSKEMKILSQRKCGTQICLAVVLGRTHTLVLPDGHAIHGCDEHREADVPVRRLYACCEDVEADCDIGGQKNLPTKKK